MSRPTKISLPNNLFKKVKCLLYGIKEGIPDYDATKALVESNKKSSMAVIPEFTQQAAQAIKAKEDLAKRFDESLKLMDEPKNMLK